MSSLPATRAGTVTPEVIECESGCKVCVSQFRAEVSHSGRSSYNFESQIFLCSLVSVHPWFCRAYKN